MDWGFIYKEDWIEGLTGKEPRPGGMIIDRHFEDICII